MGEYGQFCPVAKAAEILDQRWTILVIRELIAGSTTFNDIHRGVPRMSRSLLSKRLKSLTREGVVARHETEEGPSYRLTETGQELTEIIEAVGRWGIRWMSSLSDEDLDPSLLMWDMHRRINTDEVPDQRTVLGVTFRNVDSEVRDWWLVITRDEVDVCDTDPGYGTDVHLSAPLRTLARLWRGDIGWVDALRSERLDLRGPTHLTRRLRHWLQLSYFASTPRPEASPDALI